MLLYVLLMIICFVAILFLESFFLSLFGLSIFFVLFLFFYKKIDLKILIAISAFVSFFFDVVLNLPLGCTFLSLISSLFIYRLFSLFLSTETGFFSFVFKMLAIFFFYIITFYIQRIFVFGNLGYFDINLFVSSFVKAMVSIVLLIIFENIAQRLRGKNNGSTLRFK